MDTDMDVFNLWSVENKEFQEFVIKRLEEKKKSIAKCKRKEDDARVKK